MYADLTSSRTSYGRFSCCLWSLGWFCRDWTTSASVSTVSLSASCTKYCSQSVKCSMRQPDQRTMVDWS